MIKQQCLIASSWMIKRNRERAKKLPQNEGKLCASALLCISRFFLCSYLCHCQKTPETINPEQVAENEVNYKETVL